MTNAAARECLHNILLYKIDKLVMDSSSVISPYYAAYCKKKKIREMNVKQTFLYKLHVVTGVITINYA